MWKNGTLEKHKNAEHGFFHMEDKYSEEDKKTPTPLLHPWCVNRDRKPALGTTKTSGPHEKFYQLGVRYKRSSKISPLFVRKPTLFLHSPTPLLSSLPSSHKNLYEKYSNSPGRSCNKKKSWKQQRDRKTSWGETDQPGWSDKLRRSPFSWSFCT